MDTDIKVCGNCRYFARIEKHQDAGTCHKGPPLPLSFPQPGRAHAVTTFWPCVGGTTDWCGEWKQSRTTVGPPLPPKDA